MILYALFSETGKFLSLDPAKDIFVEVDKVTDLKIWDYQVYNDEETWFMKNNPRPVVGFSIVPIPDNDLEKLR